MNKADLIKALESIPSQEVYFCDENWFEHDIAVFPAKGESVGGAVLRQPRVLIMVNDQIPF